MSDVAANLLGVIPILLSQDVEATEQFYQEKLGFQTVMKYSESGYLVMVRDAVVVHFTQPQGEVPTPISPTCYLSVQGINALYQQALAAGVVHPAGALTDQAWGMREFDLLDPDGNWLRAGEDVS